MAVYLRHLQEQLNSGVNSMPFSWEDWVDLSYLNRFLNGQGRSCASFLTDYQISLKYEMDESLPSTEYANKSFCLDNVDYLKTPNGKYRDEKLLPGFNFMQRINEKSSFIGKVFNAKSYLLSYAPTPSLIYFLNENGTYYKIKPYQATSMMQNGLFESFTEKSMFAGFDPVKEFGNLEEKYLTHNENDFADQLLKTKNFELKIPEGNFYLNTDELFADLYKKDPSLLEENEKRFLDSVEYSKAADAEDVKKYFNEVNILWPASYNAHKLKENGGHYDARFFSGFVSEMPFSEFTFHSPYYIPEELDRRPLDNPTSRRTIILSHLLHTLLTATFHDGLYMFPAHGSLLSWYFTSMSFPYDGDGDVQMPVADLAEFCLRYNNSLIVQNPKYGLGKYYIDCTSSLTHRGKEAGTNNIDARVVDVDTGMFVDVTGLGVSADRLTASNMNKLNGWIPKHVRSKYPLSKADSKRGRRQGALASNKHKNEAAKAIQKAEANDKEMVNNVLKIHSENKIYNCRNDHYYTYEQLSPVRLTLFEGAPTFVPASKNSLTSILEQEYSALSLRRVAWEDWVYLKPLHMWVHADDVYWACVVNNLQPTTAAGKSKNKKKAKGNKKNVKGVNVVGCYTGNEATIISEMIKSSLYEITSEEVLKHKDERRPSMNIVEELYHDNLLNSVHAKEMAIYHSGWEWKTPSIHDYHGVPTKWKDLAQWMLQDHAPPRMPLFDYLSYVEAADQGKEVLILPSNETGIQW
ncbi:hypothetical protein PMKS-002885 [Pichia membranifaciens]|uniref:LicD/FKTN/FKRP nucleotidyltransferase domain-containing protein n=1 Tax=Pichia membranifaciens TaxID=4926 RepID=A0A1Q2YIP0_9ASCO|nr:hypothetical protein PMKS-002885 [Pichia membranifaciens]